MDPAVELIEAGVEIVLATVLSKLEVDKVEVRTVVSKT